MQSRCYFCCGYELENKDLANSLNADVDACHVLVEINDSGYAVVDRNDSGLHITIQLLKSLSDTEGYFDYAENRYSVVFFNRD